MKHNLIVKAKRTSRQKRYRQRLKFLKDVQNANFIKKMSASDDQALVDTDIEQIMAARPNMSNRDVIAFLRILKKKLAAGQNLFNKCSKSSEKTYRLVGQIL